MKTYKNAVKIFFAISLMALIGIAGVLFVYDPLHIYHKSWFTKESRLHGNMRLQAAGIINNYNFDSIILGTSMMKGTSEEEASEKLGGTFVNLSADGSSLYERRAILGYALKKKKLKHVIYSLDTGLDLNLLGDNRTLPLKDFEFLYDENPVNDLKAYWNQKFLPCAVTLSTSTECFGPKRELMRPSKTFPVVYEKNREISGMDNWIYQKNGRGKKDYDRVKKHLNKTIKDEREYQEKLERTYKLIDSGIIRFVKNNPDVSFHIVFPPYSRFMYSLWQQYDPLKYKLYKKTLEYMVESSTQYNNLKVYILDDLPYIDDLNNYRDMRHYNTDMNSLILDYIKSDRRINSLSDLEKLTATLDKMNSKYPLSKELDVLLDAYKFRFDFKQDYSDGKLSIRGWVLSNKVDKVELHLGKKVLASVTLKKNLTVAKAYPQYQQPRNSFYLRHKVSAKNKNLKLVFKYKNKVVKRVRVFNGRAKND